jgi:phosphopantothenoylcysteine decarboxylase/phosphopantothenate--cysteine ligase
VSSPEAGRKKRILVTAGPTREKIDPLRFISNYSTGAFGYAIADEARRRGCLVTLVSGPTALTPPAGVRCIRVESARDMRKAVLREFPSADCVIMAAAVADWRARFRKEKIKRGRGRISLGLAENPDILADLGRRKADKVLVGFALETEDLRKNAGAKLREKHLDLIIANRHRETSPAFGDGAATVLMIDRFGNETNVSRKSKKKVAEIILDKVSRFLI